MRSKALNNVVREASAAEADSSTSIARRHPFFSAHSRQQLRPDDAGTPEFVTAGDGGGNQLGGGERDGPRR